jgi:hypothetical protein
MVLATSGTQDWYELHYDPDYARAHGQAAPVVSNVFLRAMIDRLAAEWSPEARIAAMTLTIRKAVLGGETVRLSGIALAGAAPASGGTLQLTLETASQRCATARVELTAN